MNKFLTSLSFMLCTCFCFIGIKSDFSFADAYQIYNTLLPISYSSTISDIQYHKNFLYFTDTADKSIYKMNTSNKTFSKIVEKNDVAPQHLYITNNEIYFSDIYLYMKDFKNNKIIQIDKLLNIEEWEALPTICDICCSANGTGYIISENLIAKITSSYDEIENSTNFYCEKLTDLVYNTSPLTFNKGGFFVNEENTKIYFSIDNNLYTFELQTNKIEKLNLDILAQITKIDTIQVDALGNIYLLADNILYKIEENSAQNLNLNDKLKGMSIDFINGICYFFDTKQLVKSEMKNTNENFVTTYKDQPAPIKLQDIAPKNSIVTILNTNKPTKIYSFKSLNTEINSYTENKSLILLDNTDKNFYYVYDNNFNNSYLTGYILKSDCDIAPTFTPENKKIKVLAQKAKLFNLPTSIPVSETEKFPSFDNVSRNIILELVTSPVLPKDSNGTQFLAVKYTKGENTNIGYIDSRTIINTANDNTLEKTLVSNAKIRANVDVFGEIELKTKIDTLKKDTEITLIETKNKICKIQYSINGVIKTGFVKQSFINDGSLTTVQIIGIILIICSLLFAIIIATSLHLRKKHNKSKPIK